MAIKKSELYSSIWASCDELRGGMDASQYKDYVLFLLLYPLHGPRSRRDASIAADSRSWTDGHPAADFSSAASGAGTVMCPRGSASSPSTSRTRVAAQYLGASSRYRSRGQ